MSKTDAKSPYNMRRLPPPPPGIDGGALVWWKRSWRSLYIYWRFQRDDDYRYWWALEEAVGPRLAESILGPREGFKIASLAGLPLKR